MALNRVFQRETERGVLVGEGVGFERIRRITGYLVGNLDKFNNAKRAEEADRLKHMAGTPAPEKAEPAARREPCLAHAD